MKKILAFIMAVVLTFSLVACGNSGDDNTKKGVELLAGKTPGELYNAAIDYIKALDNYEILIEAAYKTAYEDEINEEYSSTLHKCSGDSFYYLYKADYYEEFFVHDGTTLYKNVNNVREKSDISYSDFMSSWGGVTEEGMLIALPETSFDKKLFIPEGEEYYVDFSISEAEYAQITGGTVEAPVTYRVYFDKDGNFVHFERQMIYYYYDVILVEDTMKVHLQNVGQVQKVSAPEAPESFAVRLKADEIDLSTVDSLDLFEVTGDITDYVLIEIKIERGAKSSEEEDDAQAQNEEGEGEEKQENEEKQEDYYGKILIRLFPEVAPLTVSNFKTLVGSSFYKGLTIHRVIPNYVIQGGCPNGDGTGGAESEIFGEFTINGFTNNLSHKRGVVSMARADEADSASSQFFICHADVSSSLDEKYAAFGYVIYGMDVVDAIAALETDSDDAPTVKVTIESTSFVKKKA